MNTDNILAKIRQKKNVVVLLLSPDDELSVRAHQAFLAYETKLVSRGFYTSVVLISAKTALIEELACVRAPQLRVFSRGKLHTKIVGFLGSGEVDSVLKVV